jgi:hypothetical protein
MKSLMRFLVLSLTVGLLALSLGCSDSDNGSVSLSTDLSNRLYVAAAESGTLTPTGNGDEFVIMLNNACPDVRWFTDRPQRDTGENSTADFVGYLWGLVYGQVAPNAVIKFHVSGENAGLFVTLKNPEYDPENETLTFQVKLLNFTFDEKPGSLEFDIPVITILDNVSGQDGASSFVIYGESASLDLTRADGQYILTQNDLDNSVLSANNAPGRYSYVSTTAAFVEQWKNRFSDSPPNAFIFGLTDSGELDGRILTLSEPTYEEAVNRITYPATVLGPETGTLPKLTSATLIVDYAGAAVDPFSKKVHGIAYSPLPAKFNAAPPPNTQFFDSDLVNDNFTAIWGSDGSCGRNDLQAMNDAGIKFVRLYDYNYARGADREGTYGKGHINFLNKAQSLGMQVVIAVSNWNFSNNQYAWENIDTTVTNIIESLKVNGVIHPAVHSFTVGNELDATWYGLDFTVLIPRAIQVVKKINALAPDYYTTIPVTTARQMDFFGYLKNGDGATITPIPSNIYNNRFYNSVQTFKLGQALTDLLALYDNDPRFNGIPLAITELGTNVVNAGGEPQMISDVVSQATIAENYLDTNANTRFKGYFIFQWQNANWKGGPGTSEASFGIHNYNGVLCTSVTGPHKGNQPQDSTVYNVDRLVPKTSTQYPNGLLDALRKIFTKSP